MRRFRCAVFAALTAISLAAGCSQCWRGTAHGGRSAPLSGDALPLVERGAIEPDVSQVGAVELVADQQRGGEPPLPLPSYRALAPEECQCLAVAASTMGNLLYGERRVAQRTSGSDSCDDSERVKRDVLAGASEEARNSSAADALRLFYTLAEAEGRLDLVRRSEHEIDVTLGRIGDLRRQGMLVPIDETAMTRQRDELHGRRAELEVTIKHLNDQLWQLIGMYPDPPGAHLWPLVDLTVRVQPYDIHEAVSYGVAMRPELNMLRRLRRSLTTDSLDSARSALGQINGLLGLSPSSPDVCRLRVLCYLLEKRKQADRELAERRRQLDEYIPERERQVALEIVNAIETTELRVQQVALAKQQAEQWRRRLAELQGRTSTGAASFAEVASAQLQTWQAEGDMLGRVVAWKIAQVELKKAQGQLVAECPH